MLPWRRPSRPEAWLPTGERVYAVGDLHGEAALFESLLAQILSDTIGRGPARTTLVLLGDIIDRGDDAASLLLTLMRISNARVVILKGNHEAAFVDCYDGDQDAMRFWLEFGGRSTLAGFGVPQHEIDDGDAATLIEALHSRAKPEVRDWIDDLPLFWSLGDYFFCHAGVRPGVPLELQDEGDLMWIREPFLSSTIDHGKVIVHGHTIEEGGPQLGSNRAGLDTGGHEHGRLTALGLEDDRQWILQARPDVRDGTGTAKPMKDRSGRFVEISRLIAAIASDAAHVEPPCDVHDQARSGRGWRRLAASLALVIAVGGVSAFVVGWSTRSQADSIDTITVPSRPEVSDARVVPRAVAPASPATIPERSIPSDRAAQSAVSDSAVDRSPSNDASARIEAEDVPLDDRDVLEVTAEAVRLTGAALEKALAEDRILTRRLNEGELARIRRERRALPREPNQR